MKDESDASDLSMTIVGSSNYGKRSLKLDLELDVLIVTRDTDLKRRIHGEERRILKYGRSVPDRHQRERDGSLGPFIEGIVVWALVMLIRWIGLSI